VNQNRVGTPAAQDEESAGLVARFALALSAWTERWVPDAFIFALVGTVLVVVAALMATPATVGDVVDAWGRGFWALIPFTLQMSLIIIMGHVLATSGPMRALIRVLAGWPESPRAAVALVTVVALVTSRRGGEGCMTTRALRTVKSG
jgi:short-chain fatty acids transporter